MATKKSTAKSTVKKNIQDVFDIAKKDVETAVIEITEEVKASPKKAAEKKTTAKTTTKTATKTVTKDVETKTVDAVYIQNAGKELSIEDIIAKAKELSEVKTIKSTNVYIKPEENMVYYVINDDVTGSFEF